MITIKVDNIESINKTLDNLNLNVEKEMLKYTSKQYALKYTGVGTYIALMSIGRLYFNIDILSIIFATGISSTVTNLLIKENVKNKLEKTLYDKFKCISEISTIINAMKSSGINVDSNSLDKENILFCNSNKNNEKLVFYDNDKKIKILKHMKKFSNGKLVKDEFKIFDECEINNDEIKIYKKKKIMSLKSNKFVEGENEDYY